MKILEIKNKDQFDVDLLWLDLTKDGEEIRSEATFTSILYRDSVMFSTDGYRMHIASTSAVCTEPFMIERSQIFDLVSQKKTLLVDYFSGAIDRATVNICPQPKTPWKDMEKFFQWVGSMDVYSATLQPASRLRTFLEEYKKSAKDGAVDLAFENGQFRFSHDGKTYVSLVDLDSVSADKKVIVNLQYLLDALQICSDDNQVTFQLTAIGYVWLELGPNHKALIAPKRKR